MDGELESLTCCVCSLGLDSMTLVEREAHVNTCCDHLSDQGDCDVISISSTEISEFVSVRPEIADGGDSSPLKDSNEIDQPCHSQRRVVVSDQFSNLLNCSHVNTCQTSFCEASSSSVEDDRNGSSKEKSTTESGSDPRKASKRADHIRASFGKKLECQTAESSSSSGEDESELIFSKSRKVFQKDLLSRLKESGKVSVSPPSEGTSSEINGAITSMRAPGSDSLTDKESLWPRVMSDGGDHIRERTESEPAVPSSVETTSNVDYEDSFIHDQPAQESQEKFRCWLCGKLILLGSLSQVDHLAVCSMLGRNIFEAILPDPENCILPETLPASIDQVDAVIKRLQRIRDTLNGLCPLSEQKNGTTVSKALPVRKTQSDQRRPKQVTAVAENPKSTSKSSKSVPPCPDYRSMTVPELKKLMANYGFRAGSKSYMVQQLCLAWEALHSPCEPMPAAIQPSECAVEDVFPERDSFRSPVRNRTRKKTAHVLGARRSELDARTESIWNFIVRHERLLEHILCLQPIDINELHAEIVRHNVTVSLKDVKAFCNFYGLNVADKWRKPQQA